MISALQVAPQICRAALVFLIVFVIYGAYGFLHNMADGSPFIWPVMLLVGVPVAPPRMDSGQHHRLWVPEGHPKDFFKGPPPIEAQFKLGHYPIANQPGAFGSRSRDVAWL